MREDDSQADSLSVEERFEESELLYEAIRTALKELPEFTSALSDVFLKKDNRSGRKIDKLDFPVRNGHYQIWWTFDNWFIMAKGTNFGEAIGIHLNPGNGSADIFKYSPQNPNLPVLQRPNQLWSICTSDASKNIRNFLADLKGTS